MTSDLSPPDLKKRNSVSRAFWIGLGEIFRCPRQLFQAVYVLQSTSSKTHRCHECRAERRTINVTALPHALLPRRGEGGVDCGTAIPIDTPQAAMHSARAAVIASAPAIGRCIA